MITKIKDEALLGDDILRRDTEVPMDILKSEKVMMFKGEQKPLHTMGEPKCKIKVLAVTPW